MARQQFSPEQIIRLLREAEVEQADAERRAKIEAKHAEVRTKIDDARVDELSAARQLTSEALAP